MRYTDRCELVEVCVVNLNATFDASLRLNPDTAASVWRLSTFGKSNHVVRVALHLCLCRCLRLLLQLHPLVDTVQTTRLRQTVTLGAVHTDDKV